MKKRRLIALVLAGCMIFGNTVWAEDAKEEGVVVDNKQQEKEEVVVVDNEQKKEDKISTGTVQSDLETLLNITELQQDANQDIEKMTVCLGERVEIKISETTYDEGININVLKNGEETSGSSYSYYYDDELLEISIEDYFPDEGDVLLITITDYDGNVIKICEATVMYPDEVIYVGKTEVIENTNSTFYCKEEDTWTVSNENEEICKANLMLTESDSESYKYCNLEIEAIKEGKTDIVVKQNGNVTYGCHLTVVAVPEVNETVYFGDEMSVSLPEEVYNEGFKIRVKRNGINKKFTGSYSYFWEAQELSVDTSKYSPNEGDILTLESYDSEGNMIDGRSAVIEYKEKNVYVDFTVTIQEKGTSYWNVDETEWEIVNENEDVCEGVIRFTDADSSGDSKYCNIELKGITEGKTDVIVKQKGKIRYAYHITVLPLPEGIITFEDPALLAALIDDGVDKNEDGFISEEELSSVTSLYIMSNNNLTNLNGLEFAVNLKEIYLRNDNNLVNVDALSKLENLKYIDLYNTNVPEETRWKLAKFSGEMDLIKGHSEELIENGILFNEPLEMTLLEGDDIVEYQYSPEANYADYILPKETGKATIRLSTENVCTDISVNVDGIPADQEVGETSSLDVDTSLKSTILSSNGTLWQLYPEVKSVKKNVTKYVGGWIYSGDDALEYAYALDDKGVLWSSDQKIAENVKDFSGHYALDNNNVLNDIYNSNPVSVENVTSWTEYRQWNRELSKYENVTYILTDDGTLWKRLEVEKDAEVNELEKVKEDIVEIDAKGYLCSNGEYYSYLGTEPTYSNAASVPKGGNRAKYYLGLDGHTYLDADDTELVDMGTVHLVDSAFCYEYEEEERLSVCYALADTGEVYRHVVGGETTLVQQNVSELVYIGTFFPMLYKNAEGNYLSHDGEIGTVDAPILISNGDYDIEDYGVVNDYNLKKNDVLILTHVKSLWFAQVGDEYHSFVTRTDGTVWDVENIPEMVLDLNEASYLRGDVNEDSEVNAADLRIVLKGVCEKIELTERQLMIADVTDDGKVDIHDLRKELRYVCGKISTLD